MPKDRFTARTDEPFVVFIIGMWLPLHENPASDGGGVIRVGPAGISPNAATGRFDQEVC